MCLPAGAALFSLKPDALGTHEYLAVATLDGAARRTRIFLAAPLEREQILQHFDAQVLAEDRLYWDTQSRSVIAERIQSLGRLVLRREPWAKPDPGSCAPGTAERYYRYLVLKPCPGRRNCVSGRRALCCCAGYSGRTAGLM